MATSVERVRDALRSAGIDTEVVELSASTRTAAEAAAAIGCTVAQIAKSLVFRTRSGLPLLVIASGPNRVDEKLVATMAGEAIERAPADFVRDATGYAIGGVPPIPGETAFAAVFVDQDLLQFREIWAAAGSPHAVVRLTPDELLRLSGGRVVRVA